MKFRPTIIVLGACVSLAACEARPVNDGVEEDDPSVEASPTPNPSEPVSILRPDIEQPDLPEPPLEPLNMVIGFPEGGAELDSDAVAALEQVLASEQLATGAPIVLRAHSDSAGSDDANAEASEERGLAVAGWLIENGVDNDRIDVIVFGEQNPVEPNALPDGSPNEEGRAANRRVEVLIVPLPDGGELEPEPVESEASDAVSD